MSTFEKALSVFLANPPPKQARFRDVQMVLEGIGYRLTRTQGSHHHFVNDDRHRITLAVHKGQVEAAAVKEIARAVRVWKGEV